MSPAPDHSGWLPAAVLALAIGGCSTYAALTDPAPESDAEAPSRYGNPPSYVALGIRYHVLPSAEGYVEQGLASWYGPNFHGKRTSSGEVFDMHQISAAHKSLPLPTWVEVTHLETGRSIKVRVNDRGPFKEGRIIDLSRRAAEELGITDEGVAPVEVRAIRGPRLEFWKTEVRFLQLGAFAAEDNAESFLQELRQRGLADLSIQSRKRHRPLHRVLHGPFENPSDFNNALENLEQFGITEYTTITQPR